MVDEQQTEAKLENKILNASGGFDIKHLAKQDIGNKDLFLVLPIDTYLWTYTFSDDPQQHLEILDTITTHKFYGYFDMIHNEKAEKSEFTSRENRNKHMGRHDYD